MNVGKKQFVKKANLMNLQRILTQKN